MAWLLAVRISHLNFQSGRHCLLSLLYESSDVSIEACLAMTLGFFVPCLAIIEWVFETNYRLKS